MCGCGVWSVMVSRCVWGGAGCAGVECDGIAVWGCGVWTVMVSRCVCGGAGCEVWGCGVLRCRGV